MIRKIFPSGKYIFLIIFIFASAFLYSAENKNKTYPHYERALSLYKDYQVWLGAVAEARMDLEENPSHLQSYLLIAQVYMEIKEYPQAADAMLSAIGKTSDNQESLNLMSKILLEWEKSKISSESLVSFYVEIARAYSKKNYYARAIEYYQKYLRLKPQDIKIRLEFARVLSWGKYYPSAIQEYNAYLKKYPQDKKIIFELANIYYWKGDVFDAEIELKKIIVLDPKNIEAYLLLARIYEQQGKHKNAVNEYRMVLQLSKNNRQAKEGLDRINKLQEKAAEWTTVSGLKKIIEETKDYRLYLTIADNLYYSENKDTKEQYKEEAFKYYRLYLEKYPEDYEAKIRIAEIFSWEKLYEESIALYRSYLEKYPDEHSIRLNMARILFWNKDNVSALKELESIQAKDPSMADLYLLRADIYEFQEKYKEALENYKLVVTLPYNQYNQEAIESILAIEKLLKIENKILPELYLQYSNIFENTYGYHKYGLDLGTRLHFNNGSLTVYAGARQYQLFQAGIDYGQDNEVYAGGEGKFEENWSWSAVLTGAQLYTFDKRLSLSVGTTLQLSPGTSFLANFYFNKEGVFEVDNLNALIAGVNMNVDDFVFQIYHKLSEKDALDGLFSQGYFSDGNNRTKVGIEYLHKISEVPLLKIGGEYEYLYFQQDSPLDALGAAYYWAPRPYSGISVVATLENNDNEIFIYRMKMAICRVMETSQTEFSLEGEASYYFSKSLSADMAVSLTRGSFEAVSSSITNIMLGITYHFEK